MKNKDMFLQLKQVARKCTSVTDAMDTAAQLAIHNHVHGKLSDIFKGNDDTDRLALKLDNGLTLLAVLYYDTADALLFVLNNEAVGWDSVYSPEHRVKIVEAC